MAILFDSQEFCSFVFSGFVRYDAAKKSSLFSSALYQRITITSLLTCASNCNANFLKFQR